MDAGMQERVAFIALGTAKNKSMQGSQADLPEIMEKQSASAAAATQGHHPYLEEIHTQKSQGANMFFV